MIADKYIRYMKQKFADRHFEDSLLFISTGILASIVCSVYAILFSFTEHKSVAFFSSYPELIFIVAPVGMVLSYFLVIFFAPGSGGSGIPQVLTCIEHSDPKLDKLFLRKVVVIIKIMSSLVAVFVGAAIGREGPSLQISAAISHHVGVWAEKIGIKIKHNQLLVAGAASGLAAAFNTPIGGIVYAIEELSKEHVKNFRDVLLLSVVISGITAQLINGSYLYLGSPKIKFEISVLSLTMIVLVGLITGILGALFSRILLALIKWRSGKKTSTQVVIVVLIGILIGLVYYFAGERSLYSGKESIYHVLFSVEKIPWFEVILRSVMPILSSMSGIAGGIFAPSLSAGAVIGGSFALFFDSSIRTVLGLTGMVGFLTGVTHTPITSFILVLEMTDRHSAVFPMMIAAVFSSIGSKLISEHSFYESSMIEIRKKHRL